MTGAGGGGRALGGGGGGPGPPRASPPLPAPPTALLLAAQQQAATAPTPGRAGSDLNPKVLLNPMLHRRFGGGGARWGLLRAHVAEPTRIKACPRLHDTSVQMQKPADARGWPDFSVQTHGLMHARALTHTHIPNYLRDGESRSGLASRTVTHAQGAGTLRKAVSFFFFFFFSLPFHLMVKQQQSSES
ncbi:uncharacterized protein LOC119471079 [Cebus imitator]|uniref:uncharacterized protein LOC119471079 n=1 Tax=Cebus imitator TaxID=2715852 RepID=UPI00189A37DB|nr:uncharacterized protein LOC119471079 [Cebus imitator]